MLAATCAAAGVLVCGIYVDWLVTLARTGAYDLNAATIESPRLLSPWVVWPIGFLLGGLYLFVELPGWVGYLRLGIIALLACAYLWRSWQLADDEQRELLRGSAPGAGSGRRVLRRVRARRVRAALTFPRLHSSA